MDMEGDIGGGGGRSVADHFVTPPPVVPAHQQQHQEEGDDEEEFMDLEQLSALSDGDLCMGRQLAAAIARSNEEAGGTGPGPDPKQELKSIKEEQPQEEQEVQQAEGIVELVDTIKGEFLPTEAVEQFLRGMGDAGEGGDEAATAHPEPTPPSPAAQKKTKCQRGSSSESRPTASPAEFAAPPPPPIVISPQEVDHISITLEKNQQCACKDCGKLFNSVWYLKQHAVKHSNDRPFKCRFCMKTYKFRSNLYQHKCPERNRLLLAGEFNLVGHPYRRRAYNRSSDKAQKGVAAGTGQAGASSSSTITINTSAANEGDFCVATADTFGQPVEMGPGLLMVGTGMMTEAALMEAGEQQHPHCMGFNGGGTNGDSYLAQMPFSGQYAGTTTTALNHSLLNEHSVLEPLSSFSSPSSSLFGSQSRHLNGDKSGESGSTSTIAREHELPAELFEQYVRRNRHRVFNCRKCKLYFPSREYFARHIAYHNELEEYKYCCEKCPERFQSDAALQAHQLQHADQSPHCCLNCNGVFRSALALRRHKDSWRQCHSPVGMQYSLAVNPIDQYAFVESDLDELEPEERSDEERREHEEEAKKQAWPEPGEDVTRKTTRDSGYQGSDTYSPPTGSHSPLSAAAMGSEHSMSCNGVVTGPRRDEHGRFAPMKAVAEIDEFPNGSKSAQNQLKKGQVRPKTHRSTAENTGLSKDKNNNKNEQQLQQLAQAQRMLSEW